MRDVDPGCFHLASSKQILPVLVDQEQMIWQRNCHRIEVNCQRTEMRPCIQKDYEDQTKSADNRLSLPEVLGL